MRKVAAVVLTAVALVSVPFITPGAAAVGGPSCAKTDGKLTFSPALPKSSSSATVKGTLAGVGTFSKCKGGGVVSAHWKLATKKATTGSSCKAIASFSGVLTVTWNTGTTSTIALTIKPVKSPTVTGSVTGGIYKGALLTAKLKYKLPAGACATKTLSVVTVTQLSATVIN